MLVSALFYDVFYFVRKMPVFWKPVNCLIACMLCGFLFSPVCFVRLKGAFPYCKTAFSGLRKSLSYLVKVFISQHRRTLVA